MSRKPDPRSPEAAHYHRWYGLACWKTRRARQLAKEPNCRRCKKRGRITIATVANHIVPHRGDWTLFTRGELESLCDTCHNASAQAEDLRGFSREPGFDGWPDDPRHPFNRKAET